jgi:hypothetical protein
VTTPRHPDTVYRGKRIEGPRGEYIGVEVTVNGEPLALPPRGLRVSFGVEWGYRGAGALNLALALILDATGGNRSLALRAYHWYCHADVEGWGSTWRTTAADIRRWLKQFTREDVIDFPDPEDDDAHLYGMTLTEGAKGGVA